jgi:hypothetical protein
MKARKVIITIEAKSDMPLKELRGAWKMFSDADYWYDIGYECKVHQVHVQVVREDK